MKTKRKRLVGARHLITAVSAGFAVVAFASAPAFAAGANTGYFGSVAIEGYDTVAYFTDGKATKGSEEFAYDWLGASWHFATEEHRKLFSENPVSYAPQFGGICAEGLAFQEMTVNIEPEAWQIIDGKLYLTAGAHFVGDYGELLPDAEENWPAAQAELTN